MKGQTFRKRQSLTREWPAQQGQSGKRGTRMTTDGGQLLDNGGLGHVHVILVAAVAEQRLEEAVLGETSADDSYS